MKKWKNCLKRNSTIIVLFILLLGFSRCGWIFEDTRISPEKPPLLRMGDTLIFNSSVNIDSFYVERAKLYKVNEDDGSGREWDRERYYSTINQIDCIDSCYGFRSTIRPQEYFVWTMSLGYSNEISPDYVGGIKLRDYVGGRELKIGKYGLKDLYECNKTFDTLSIKDIKSFLYSKKYGVVEYILTKGETFHLSEESLEMLMARE